MIVTGPGTVEFTAEQLYAIQERDGDLFLDAGAGSGKTSVLVERFVQAVLEDGVEVGAILTITFTDQAAAQMRDRIRTRMWQLGAVDAARETEGAYISTIHGFCARVLRAQALSAGIDPAFTVLGELEAGRLADAAFEEALTALARDQPGAVELIAAYGAWDLRVAIQSVYAELRSRGGRHPRLPPLPEAPHDMADQRRRLIGAVAVVRAELAALAEPSVRVVQALDRLRRVDEVVSARQPWPGDLDRLRLPGGNGAALSTPACVTYTETLERVRGMASDQRAASVIALLDQLLIGFGQRYELRKREHTGLDFEDLELICRDLLRSDGELRERYQERFTRVMVDELQDTNAVQLELIETVSQGNLFTVGDAQQSIYGFRHADVELFERRGELLAELGRRATVQTNFRSRPEILRVINRVFTEQLGDSFRGLIAGRPGPSDPVEDPRVELLVVDRDSEWSPDGPSAAWRRAEARALAARVEELLVGGAAPRDVVVLTRAATDMRAYERALEERGIPTYTVGGRGYWSHPQVVDLVAYLRALANPRDEEALYLVLGSPLVGISPDGLVLLAAAARSADRDPWWVLREPNGMLDELAEPDRSGLRCFVGWMAGERRLAARKGVEELLDRMLEQTGYDLVVLAMPGGQRRLANVRKLMRLGREHDAAEGPDLRGFVDLVRRRAESWRPDPDQSEAPIESEALDAVRLMTIHRAKGLEFEIVCVADLGRGARWGSAVLRVGRDGRLGLRLARPGTGGREPAMAYDELGEQQRAAEAREERRLFYVAMTRARERLILSGAAKLEAWGGAGGGGSPIAWLGPALVAEVAAGAGVYEGVRFTVVRPGDVDAFEPLHAAQERPGPLGDARPAAGTVPTPLPQPSGPPVASLSYTALSAYKRCGYRFYVERVLGVPGSERGQPAIERPSGSRSAVLAPAERGTVVHALLERLDFRRPVVPSSAAIIAASPRQPSAAELEQITELVQRFAGTELCARLGRATRVRREQRFGFLLDGALITGMLDVIASEAGNETLIVDYKTDRLVDASGQRSDPSTLVARGYSTQQLVYALAALRSGAQAVEVVHVFLEAPEAPVSVSYNVRQVAELELALAELTEGVLRRGSFPVSDTPHRELCSGCPAEGGLCSWPLQMTRRESPEQLF